MEEVTKADEGRSIGGEIAHVVVQGQGALQDIGGGFHSKSGAVGLFGRRDGEKEAQAEREVRAHGVADHRDRAARRALGRRYWRKLKQMLKVDVDAVVAHSTALRWASFAKTGDPNDEVTTVMARS